MNDTNVRTNTNSTNDTNKLSKRVVALSSGTAAVHLGLLNCGVGPGDEVIVQSFTFCASSHPITYLGATPVFVDSEKDTWNMDPELLEVAIKDRIAKTGKKPKRLCQWRCMVCHIGLTELWKSRINTGFLLLRMLPRASGRSIKVGCWERLVSMVCCRLMATR